MHRCFPLLCINLRNLYIEDFIDPPTKKKHRAWVHCYNNCGLGYLDVTIVTLSETDEHEIASPKNKYLLFWKTMRNNLLWVCFAIRNELIGHLSSFSAREVNFLWPSNFTWGQHAIFITCKFQKDLTPTKLSTFLLCQTTGAPCSRVCLFQIGLIIHLETCRLGVKTSHF